MKTPIRTGLLILALWLGAGPVNAQTQTVAGLTAPIDIVTDREGVPHITAASIEDAFFGQGYAAATARLWQMDIGRRRALGHLAAAFGPDFVPYDRAARLMLFRGDLAAEWHLYDPRVPAIAAAWVRGLNARVREVRANPALLPPEFAALDVLPDLWAPEDLLRMRGTGPNVRGEVRRAALACAGALAADAVMVKLEPAWTLAVPAGLEPCQISHTDLATYDLLSAPLPWARAATGAPMRLPRDDVDARNGSNAWVIAPSRSATGRAILANDPHLGFSVPGARFITHLRAPGLDAIGAGPANRPGFQFGHNDRIAFGRTDFQIDQEDLYLLRLNDDASAYRTATGWQRLERITETIAVRGAPDVSVSLAFSPLGPLISESAGRAVALRSVFLQPGGAVALEYVPVVLAQTWPQYLAALNTAVWGSNYMYADVDGNIGWQAAGRVPRRPNHDGLLPVPADGDYPWSGILPVAEMPGEFNPARGWIATANQMPFPPDFPYASRKISFEWIADDRYRRIADVLATQPQHRLADSVALQLDVRSGRAEALIPLLNGLATPGLDAEAAMLRGWDAELRADSAPAALFEVWWAMLQTRLHAVLVPPAQRALLPLVHPHVMLAVLQHPDNRLGADPVRQRDAILVDALRAATLILQQRFGANIAGWAWGKMHTVDLHHSLGAHLPPALRARADVTGGPSGGDGATVMARWWANAARPNVTGGAQFRAVLDVGNWDASLAINAPGQSGDPGSPHYADLQALWLAGAMFPFTYSPAAIDAAAEQRLHLQP